MANPIFNLTPDEKVSRAKVQLYTKAPFFSYLIENMQVFEDTAGKLNIPTMGVNAKNQMYYNPKFVADLDDDHLLGVLCHEVMHCALEHPFRGAGRNIILQTPSGNVSLWNIAIDIVVNAIILKNGFKLPKDCFLPDTQADSIEVFGAKIVDISNKSAEEIYDELKQVISQAMQKKPGKGSKGDGGTLVTDIDGELGFDQHDFDGTEKPEPGKEGKGDKGDKDWKQIMADATTYSKQRGTDPLGLGRDYDILNKSCINWRAILRREIAKSIPVDYTWARPSRKFMSQGIYLPSTTSEEVKVLFAIDLSGSVSRDEMSMYMAEIKAIADIFPSVEMRIITHDHEVCDDFHITSSTKRKLLALKMHGGGGTDMVCVHDHIKAKGYNKGYAIMFHFTDGYGSFPNKSAIPSYIILSENHCAKEDLPRWSLGNIPLSK